MNDNASSGLAPAKAVSKSILAESACTLAASTGSSGRRACKQISHPNARRWDSYLKSGKVLKKRAGISRFFRRDQSMAHGVADQLRLVLNAQFLHQGCAMIFHGSRADVKELGDFAVRLSFRHHLQHFALPRRERLVRIERPGVGLVDVSLNCNFRHRRAQKPAAGRRLADGPEQVLFRAALEYISGSPE